MRDGARQSTTIIQEARPFLRWAGGKQKLAKALLKFAPAPGSYHTYYEPFFGGGSIFFSLRPESAVVSDVNEDLMECYRQVACSPLEVAQSVRELARQDSPEFYYQLRSTPTDTLSPVHRAARFVYLNKAAFNGIYRVNKLGQFNVPYGPSPNGPAIPSLEILAAAAECLRKATIVSADFEDALEDAGKGDFVYLDPPYPPRSSTAYFVHYSAQRFSWNEQVRVAAVFRDLSSRGCLVMLSNADQKKVASLYRGYRITRLHTVRWLGSNGDRFGVREIVVTNYGADGPAGESGN